MPDESFQRIIFEGYRLVSVNVLYFLPDQNNLVNEFFWQTLDLVPRYPRVHRFLRFWRDEIDAKIKQVTLAEVTAIPHAGWKNGIILDLD